MFPGSRPSTVLPAGADPLRDIRQNRDYVERRVHGAGIEFLGGPFRLDLDVDRQTSAPRRSFVMDRSKFSIDIDPLRGRQQHALTATIRRSEAEARAAVNRSSFRGPGIVVYTHYRGHENIIFPTIMSDTTTPQLIRPLRAAVQEEREFARAAQGTLLDAFFTLGGLRYATRPRAPRAPGALAELRLTARALIDEVRRGGGRVVVNLGGVGEFQGAINVNNMTTGRTLANIPRLVRANAELVGEIFPARSVDSVVSNDIVFGQVNWPLAARGCSTILKSGGRVTIAPFVGLLAEHLQVIVDALRAAGFRDVVVLSSRGVRGVAAEAGQFVTAIRP
ncbi:MAG: hypothetical protein L0219_18945 [Phycisphaerales bacterium]|nr:hypothetical protein [Phycisphaerales bacterium]